CCCRSQAHGVATSNGENGNASSGCRTTNGRKRGPSTLSRRSGRLHGASGQYPNQPGTMYLTEGSNSSYDGLTKNKLIGFLRCVLGKPIYTEVIRICRSRQSGLSIPVTRKWSFRSGT